MTLLTPAALFGLALLAIPIVVHLFKPRHVRQTPFSSLRWLHLTQQRMARRIQWHQVLLFLLRASFLTLMVLALSRPIWSPTGTAAGRDRILVLDVSRSMGRHVEGRSTPWEAARDIASQLVRSSLPGDRTAILLTGHATEILAPWTNEGSLYLPALSSLTPKPTETRLDSALEPIRSLLAQRRAHAQVEVVFLTDNPSNGWNSTAIASLTRDVAAQPGITWRVIDVGLPVPRNAWIIDARLWTVGADNVLHVEASCVGESSQPRTLHVTGLSGVQNLELPVVLEPSRRAAFDLPLPSTFVPAGSQAVLRLEPGDELPDDDTFYVDLDSVGASRMLLLEPNRGTDAGQRPGLALESAIRSLAEAGASAAEGQLVLRTPASLTVGDITAADVLLLADVPGLNEALTSALAERVRTGAGLAVFLGPSVDHEIYNRNFVDPLEASQSLLPSPLAGSASAATANNELAPWLGWNDQHSLLTGLVDPEIGDLAGTQSRTWFRFAESLLADAEVLATLGDGTPMLIARQVGAGRVVIVNASADDRWCDLPRRKSFVPLVDRLLMHLQLAGHRRQFTSGETITVTLPESFDDAKPPQVTSPTGRTLPSQIHKSSGRTWLKLTETLEAGFYRISAQDSSEADVTLVVQPGRGDSRLEPFDPDKFRSWWSPVEITVERPTAAAVESRAADRRLVLEPWLIAAACLVFLAEMFLVHWLCPRINPAVSASHHRRKGFVAPLRERQGVAP